MMSIISINTTTINLIKNVKHTLKIYSSNNSFKLENFITESLIKELESLVSIFRNKDNQNNLPVLENSYENYKLELREQISFLYKNTKFVLKSKIVDEFYTQDGVKYLFKHLIIDEFKNKPINISDNNTLTMKDLNKNLIDPFEPPFEDDQVIEENFGNFGTHRIFFSKFAIMDEHVLLVTRDFFSQNTHLSFDDIKNSILLMDTMNGVIFFNGGKNAGASQHRKHLQCIPYKSMYNKEFGIFQLIKNQEKLEEINLFILSSFCNFYKIKLFDQNGIKHILVKFSTEFTYLLQNNLSKENIEIFTEFIFNIYNICLINLNIIQDEDNITVHYSLLLNSEWMFVIPRKASEVKFNKGVVNINSIAYLMAILIKNNDLGEEIKTKNILNDIFSVL